MWGTNLDAVPNSSDLWYEVAAQIRVDAVEKALWHKAWPKPAGASRVYVEGDQPATAEDSEDRAWGRVVVVPVDALEDPAWKPGLPVTLDFLLRAEVNSRAQAPPYRHSYHLQQILRECFRRLQNWHGPLASTQVMMAQPVRARRGWRAAPIDDRQQTGTYMLSQAYRVDVVEALTAI